MKRLAISIVNYNAGDYLIDCLRSINDISHEADIEVWIVDNNSKDGSTEKAKKEFPEYKYIINKDNLGFGRAHNIALRQIKSEYVLILNPDTKLKKGVISNLIDQMEKDENIGAATCEILLDNNKVDLTAHRGFPTPWASFLYFLGNDSLYHLSKSPRDKIHEVDAISGAFFLTRQKILEEVNYFDEDYFMYAEDIDLCFKIKQKGYKIIYDPTVAIVHYKGVSSGLKKQTQKITTASLETRQRSLNAFYETMIIFYKKHYAKKYPFFVNGLIYLAINTKWWLAKRKLTV